MTFPLSPNLHTPCLIRQTKTNHLEELSCQLSVTYGHKKVPDLLGVEGWGGGGGWRGGGKDIKATQTRNYWTDLVNKATRQWLRPGSASPSAQHFLYNPWIVPVVCVMSSDGDRKTASGEVHASSVQPMIFTPAAATTYQSLCRCWGEKKGTCTVW